MAESAGDIFGPIDAETGDTSQWTTTDIGANNAFTADEAAKNEESYGFKVLFGGTDSENGAYKSVADPADFYSRCYVYIDSGFTGPVWNFCDVLLLGDGNWWTYCAAIRFALNGSGVPYGWRFYSSTALESIDDTAHFSMNVWHFVEIHWKQHATAGGWECWIDGDSVGNEWNVDTSGLTCDRVYGGGFGTIANDGAFCYTDDYKGDTSYIGAYQEEEEAGNPWYHYAQQ